MAEITPDLPTAHEPLGASDGKIRGSLVTLRDGINGGLDNTNLSGSAGITRANLASEAKPLTWYTPKVIATEQTRESTSFGKLSTADEITNVILPANGLIQIGYVANWKSSVSGAGRAAIFLGSNQLKSKAAVQETSSNGTSFHLLTTGEDGIGDFGSGGSAFVTTGEVLSGVTQVFAAAGTYTISVQFKATSGSVTAKERKLWVSTLG